MRSLILAYWQSHGGLAQEGYPISGELQETNVADHHAYTMQYFERALLEYHPENQSPYNVLPTRLGAARYAKKYPHEAPGQRPNREAGSLLFDQTRHRLGGLFLQYWQEHGAVAQQGYPISDEFTEVSEMDGKPYTVQYLERAVFELHAENAGTPYAVLLISLARWRSTISLRLFALTAPENTPPKRILEGCFLLGSERGSYSTAAFV